MARLGSPNSKGSNHNFVVIAKKVLSRTEHNPSTRNPNNTNKAAKYKESIPYGVIYLLFLKL
jgi:hypothetical protein